MRREGGGGLSGSRFERLGMPGRAALLVGVVVALALLLGLLLEGGLRLRAWMQAGYGSPFYGIEWMFETDPATGMRRLKPGHADAYNTINALGFKGPAITRDKPPGGFRIAFLGGSTTFGAATRYQRNWPHIATEAVRRALPGTPVDYVNAAIPGARAARSLQRFTDDVAPLAPDLVVIYHTTNDLKHYSREAAAAQGIAAAEERERSWLARYSLTVYLVEKNLDIWRLRSAARDPGGKISTPAGSLAVRFEADYRALVRRAKASGARVVALTFLPRLRADQGPAARVAAAETGLYYMPYLTVDAMLDGFDAFNETIRRVAAQVGIALVDTAGWLPADDLHYADSVHFTDAGAAVFGRRLGEELARLARP